MGYNNIHVGSISGGRNNIKQNNYHIKNVQHNHGGSGGRGNKRDDAGDGLAILIGIFAVMVVTAFFYLRYYELIMTYLTLGAVTACATHMMSAVPIWQSSQNRWDDIAHPLGGMALAAAQVWIVTMTFNAMPAEVIQLAKQYAVAKFSFPQAMEFWNRFNAYGHHLIIRNMMTALCLVPAILLNLLYALQHLLQLLAQSYESDLCENLADRLHRFKAVGPWAGMMFMVLAYLIITGTIFTHTP
jgi:hypothetical protein